MNIECPNCQASYAVPDKRLGGRRLVRCSACGHRWAVRPGENDPPVGADVPWGAEPSQAVSAGETLHESEAPSAGAPDWNDRLAPARPERSGSILLTGAWAASIVLLLSLGAAAYVWRSAVVAAWPPAGRILAAAAGPAGHERS